jgi:hypothetical protein
MNMSEKPPTLRQHFTLINYPEGSYSDPELPQLTRLLSSTFNGTKLLTRKGVEASSRQDKGTKSTLNSSHQLLAGDVLVSKTRGRPPAICLQDIPEYAPPKGYSILRAKSRSEDQMPPVILYSMLLQPNIPSLRELCQLNVLGTQTLSLTKLLDVSAPKWLPDDAQRAIAIYTQHEHIKEIQRQVAIKVDQLEASIAYRLATGKPIKEAATDK